MIWFVDPPKAHCISSVHSPVHAAFLLTTKAKPQRLTIIPCRCLGHKQDGLNELSCILHLACFISHPGLVMCCTSLRQGDSQPVRSWAGGFACGDGARAVAGGFVCMDSNFTTTHFP